MKFVVLILVLSAALLQSVTTPPFLATHLLTVGDIAIIQVQGPARMRGTTLLLEADGVAPNLAVFLCTNVVQVNFATESGHDYEVESSLDFRDWQRTGVVYEGTGEDANWYELFAGKKFFRVITK